MKKTARRRPICFHNSNRGVNKSAASTPGFLGQATAPGGFYTFNPSVTLLPRTQYFFYENSLLPGGAISGGNRYAGGHDYFTDSPNSSFAPGGQISANFRVTGSPTNVPDDPAVLHFVSPVARIGDGVILKSAGHGDGF